MADGCTFSACASGLASFCKGSIKAEYTNVSMRIIKRLFKTHRVPQTIADSKHTFVADIADTGSRRIVLRTSLQEEYYQLEPGTNAFRATGRFCHDYGVGGMHVYF